MATRPWNRHKIGSTSLHWRQRRWRSAPSGDGGRTFCALRAGLPQQHCYDLIYRPAQAVADDGSTLLMGSTSGGVWLSEDGDGWRAIATTLPPVYAVCFA